MESIFNKANVQACLNAKRLERAGNVWKAKDKLIHEVLINKPNGKRPRERPRQLDRLDRVIKYLETTQIEDVDDKELW